MDKPEIMENERLSSIEAITTSLSMGGGKKDVFTAVIDTVDEYFQAEIYVLLIKTDNTYCIEKQYALRGIEFTAGDFIKYRNSLYSYSNFRTKEEKYGFAKQVVKVLAKLLSRQNFTVQCAQFLSINNTDFLICINYSGKRIQPGDRDYITTVLNLLNYQVQFNILTARRAKQEHIEKNLLRYFSPALISKLKQNTLNDVEESEVEVVIMFIDVRHFVTLTEKRSPVETVNMLNTYLRKIVNIIIQNYGNIDKYIGDAVCAYWGFPKNHKNDSLLAILTAFAIHREINSLKAKGDLPEDFFVGIGIHKGPAIIGDIGAEERLEVSLIGDSVLLAESMCDIAPPGKVIVTETVKNEAGAAVTASDFENKENGTEQRGTESFIIESLTRNHYDILMEAL